MSGFPTNDFNIFDPADPTKALDFNCSTMTSGTGFSRTVSVVDYPGIMVLADAENSGGTLKLLYHYGSSTTAPTWSAPTLPDNLFRIADNGDSSKLLAFECSGISTTTTRTVTIQDADGTMAYLADIPSNITIRKASTHLTAQGAAITPTTIYAGVGSPVLVSWFATITRAATTSSVLGGANGFQVVFTDPDDSVVKTSSPTTVTAFTSAANTTGTMVGGSIMAVPKSGTNLQYAFDYTSVGGTTMQYNLSVIVSSL